MTKVQIAARTDAGKIRTLNEDNFVIASDLKNGIWNMLPPDSFEMGEWGLLLMIADGMGGAEAGEVASEIAVNSVQNTFSGLSEFPGSDDAVSNFMINALITAHQAILDHVSDHPSKKGMGTTGIIGWLTGNKLYLAWSGDSRAYHWHPEYGLKMISSDHSLVWAEVMNGSITPEQARVHPQSHIITQSLGDEKSGPKPEVVTEEIFKGSKILLCSDGLNGMVSDAGIAEILMMPGPPADTCIRLIETANHEGGEDNTTVILVEIVASDDNHSEEIDPAAPTKVIKNNPENKWWKFW